MLRMNRLLRSFRCCVSGVAHFVLNITEHLVDIAGFTAWSSAREPQQVFQLLETIYAAFDKIAYRHNVFKIETVGDCYVAAAGLPNPQEEHALIIARFARDCLQKMSDLTSKLEVSLGPDTTDLELRVGLNTGQVTVSYFSSSMIFCSLVVFSLETL